MKVVFACSANAWRSPIAEALLKKNKPDIHIDSAGTYAYRKVIKEVEDLLTRENAEEYVKKVPESLDSKQLNEYDIIVAMEPKHKKAILDRCPECQSKIVVWNIDDPIGLPPGYGEKIFDRMRESERTRRIIVRNFFGA
jgi:protein-tyrosine-phosphatase